jgi:hypothetical protein
LHDVIKCHLEGIFEMIQNWTFVDAWLKNYLCFTLPSLQCMFLTKICT